MNPIVNFLLSEIIIVPVILGIIKYRQMEKSYRPFILLLLAAVVTELVNYTIFVRNGIPNAPAIKIYSLVECILILFLFHGWRFLKENDKLFYLIIFLFFGGWFIESILFAGIKDFSPYFRIFYSFIVVLLSVNQINYTLMVTTEKNLLRNSKFLICIAFVIFFIYQILYEAAYFVSDYSEKNNSLTSNIISYFGYINLLVNLIFIPAVYFIPKQGKFFFRKHTKINLNNRNE